MPPTIREGALKPNLQARYEHNDLSIQFYALDHPTVQWINAEVRGNDDPLPVLAAICLPQNWLVLDSGDNTIVRLDQTQSSAWDRFREWRNNAFRQNSMDGDTTV